MKKLFFILSLVLLTSCTTDEIDNDNTNKTIKGIWVTQSENYNKFVIFEDNGIGASFQLYDHKKGIRKNETRQAGIKAPNPTITKDTTINNIPTKYLFIIFPISQLIKLLI